MSTIYRLFKNVGYKALGIVLLTIVAIPTTVKADVVSDPIAVEPASSWQLRAGSNSKLKSADGSNRGTANVVLTHGNTLFVGGDFTEIYNGGQIKVRSYLAAFDRYTGEPTSFAPKLDNKVNALALSPDKKTLYVGGGFNNANNKSRKRFAAYDIQTGALKGLNIPSPNGFVNAIAVNQDLIYIGGGFTKIGDKNRSYLAAFDSATGALDNNFTPSPAINNNGKVSALVLAANKLWVGGTFFKVNNVEQRGLAAVNLKTGSLYDTDGVFHDVIDLAATDTQLFVAIGGPGGKAAAINLATGKQQWQIVSDGNVQAVDVGDGPYVYFGGHYEIMHHHSKSNDLELPIDFPRNDATDRLTRHFKANGKMDVSWIPEMNGLRSVNAIDVTPNGLYFGGDFTTVKKKSREGFSFILGQTSGEPGVVEPEPPIEEPPVVNNCSKPVYPLNNGPSMKLVREVYNFGNTTFNSDFACQDAQLTGELAARFPGQDLPDGKNWRYELMRGNNGNQHNMAYGDTIKGKRWLAWYDRDDRNYDFDAERVNGIFDTARVDYFLSKTYVDKAGGYLVQKGLVDYAGKREGRDPELHASWLDTYAKEWNKEQKNHYTIRSDHNLSVGKDYDGGPTFMRRSPNITFAPNTYFEIAVNFEEMYSPGHRHSFVLMPATNASGHPVRDSKIYNSDPSDGLEINIYEHEHTGDHETANLLYMKALGGKMSEGGAGNTSNEIAVPAGAKDPTGWQRGQVPIAGINEGWHTIGLLWTNEESGNSLRWFVNGLEVVRDTQKVPENIRMYMMLTREMTKGKSTKNSSMTDFDAREYIDDIDNSKVKIKYVRAWDVSRKE